MKLRRSKILFYSFFSFIAQLTSAQDTVAGRSRIRSNNNLYREEFETYETLQRGRPITIPEGKANGGLRTKYVEFAETEYSRNSFYLPIPFLSPVNNKLQMIPARTLSQLIRQHIAHTRMKQLAIQNIANNQILQGVRQITELRQTPFRRWSVNNSRTYEEKRRQWKAEMKRRLQNKLPARIIPPLLISGGGHTSIQTDREPDDRYFVTYSPQTRIYQVSRKPPPFLYTTDRDALPEQLNEDYGHRQVTAEPTFEKSTETSADQQDISSVIGTSPEPGFTVLPTITTNTDAPIIIILQKAQIVLDPEKEHRERVLAINKEKKTSKKVGKQILFLDDYEQEVEEENEDDEPKTTIQTITTTIISPSLVSLPGTEPERTSADAYRMKELEEARQQLKQQLFHQNTDDYVQNDDDDDHEEDDDLFFFKPGSGQDLENEPFQILVHGQGRHK